MFNLGGFWHHSGLVLYQSQITVMAFEDTVVPGFGVLGISVLPGFSAPKAGNGAWTLFGFRAPLTQLYINKILIFYSKKSLQRIKMA